MRHLKHFRVIAPFTLLMVVLTIVVTNRHALALTLVTVSGPSPYDGCSTAGQTGTVYVNAEVEPWVSVNPANHKHIIGVWQQDRWSNGGAQGLVAGFSSNGGTSWGETPLPLHAGAPNATSDPLTRKPSGPAAHT